MTIWEGVIRRGGGGGGGGGDDGAGAGSVRCTEVASVGGESAMLIAGLAGLKPRLTACRLGATSVLVSSASLSGSLLYELATALKFEIVFESRLLTRLMLASITTTPRFFRLPVVVCASQTSPSSKPVREHSGQRTTQSNRAGCFATAAATAASTQYS